MAELSSESGVPVPTIKFYLREGLLPAGERTSRNQANYGEAHVRRLQLVRALLDIGGLSIAKVREVVDALDSETPTDDVLGLAHSALTLPTVDASEEQRAHAFQRVQQAVASRGWELDPENNAVQALVAALCAFQILTRGAEDDWLETYLDAAEQVAESDLDSVANLGTTESIVETAVLGTVLGDTVLAALRRIAQKHTSMRRFGTPAE